MQPCVRLRAPVYRRSPATATINVTSTATNTAASTDDSTVDNTAASTAASTASSAAAILNLHCGCYWHCWLVVLPVVM